MRCTETPEYYILKCRRFHGQELSGKKTHGLSTEAAPRQSEAWGQGCGKGGKEGESRAKEITEKDRWALGP